jgi:Uma2 family endonuclease
VSTQPAFVTPEEYLRRERLADFRSQYLNGEVFAMSGATWGHNLICTNITSSLHSQFKDGPCEVVATDQRVRVKTGDLLYTYPDIIVVCGEPRFVEGEFDNLLNPKIIIEILSPSTESFDRGKKFTLYAQLDSLAEYVLVSQERLNVDHFVRQPTGEWLFSGSASLETVVTLPSVGATLKLADIYNRVKFK